MKVFLAKPLKKIKSDLAIALEWDRLAQIRHEQIISKRDVSYHHVIVPTLLSLCKEVDLTRVLDVGCGSGYLDFLLSKKGSNVIGIDPSDVSIRIAKASGDNTNPQFVCSTAQRFADRYRGRKFTSIIANMTLQDCADLASTMDAISRLLSPNSSFVATLTHPAFWPRYWGYDKAPWFKYSKEIAIEAPFRISREVSKLRSTHFHRPLSVYMQTFLKAGLQVVDVREPMPSSAVESYYPARWEFPRFLAFRCIKRLR